MQPGEQSVQREVKRCLLLVQLLMMWQRGDQAQAPTDIFMHTSVGLRSLVNSTLACSSTQLVSARTNGSSWVGTFFCLVQLRNEQDHEAHTQHTQVGGGTFAHFRCREQKMCVSCPRRVRGTGVVGDMRASRRTFDRSEGQGAWSLFFLEKGGAHAPAERSRRWYT